MLKLCEVSVTLQNRHRTYAGTRRNPRRSVNPRHEPRHTRDTAADSRDTAADSLNTLPCKGSQRLLERLQSRNRLPSRRLPQPVRGV